MAGCLRRGSLLGSESARDVSASVTIDRVLPLNRRGAPESFVPVEQPPDARGCQYAVSSQSSASAGQRFQRTRGSRSPAPSCRSAKSAGVPARAPARSSSQSRRRRAIDRIAPSLRKAGAADQPVDQFAQPPAAIERVIAVDSADRGHHSPHLRRRCAGLGCATGALRVERMIVTKGAVRKRPFGPPPWHLMATLCFQCSAHALAERHSRCGTRSRNSASCAGMSCLSPPISARAMFAGTEVTRPSQ